MTDTNETITKIEPHAIRKKKYVITMDIDTYYTDRLTTDELTRILKRLLNERGVNWIIVGTTWSDTTNKETDRIVNKNLSNWGLYGSSTTRININSEDSDSILDSEIKKINEAIYKAIPKIDDLTYKDSINTTNVYRKYTWRITSNNCGILIGIPIIIAVGNGHVKTFIAN